MVCITHFVVSAFLIVSSPFGTSSGFSISNRDSDLSAPQSSSLSSISTLTTSSTTGSPTNGIDREKTQIVLNTADQQHQTSLKSTAAASSVAAAQHVPLDPSGSGGSSRSSSRTVTVVKREVSSTDGGKVNGLYDPSLMIMSKRSAAALNKLMLALRSFDEPASSSSYENSVEGTNKETSGRFPKVLFRTSGSGIQFEPFNQNGVQRRGQKDRKFLRCYFNAVSCFRRRK